MKTQRRPPAVWRWGWRILSGATLVLGLAVIALAVWPVLRMLLGIVWHDEGFTLAALRQAFGDGERLLQLQLNSLLVMGGTLLVAMLLGVPLGFLCFRTDLPGRRLAILAAVVGACVPLYVTTAGWMAWLGSAFWLTLDSDLHKALGAAWIQGVGFTPLVVLISGVSFSQADPELEELARLDGSPLAVWRRVILPQAAWALAAAALALSVLCFGDITVTDLLVVRTYPEETFMQFQVSSDPWAGTATSLPVIAFLLAACLLLWRWLRHHADQRRERPPATLRLSLPGKLGGLLLLLLVAALILVPIVHLVLAIEGLTNLRNGLAGVAEEVMLTAWIVPLAATISMVIGVGWAGWVVRHPRSRWCSAGLLLLLLAVPAPIVGIGLIQVFNHDGWRGVIYDSPVIVVLALTIRALPLTVLALLPSLRAVPDELNDAAALEGATWLQRQLWLILPLCWRGLLLGWALAMILALGELGASVLVVPPGATTVTVRFFTLIHYGLYPDAASMCLLVLLVLILPALLLAALLSRHLTHRWQGRPEG